MDLESPKPLTLIALTFLKGLVLLTLIAVTFLKGVVPLTLIALRKLVS
jgi:hypothetical protein